MRRRHSTLDSDDIAAEFERELTAGVHGLKDLSMNDRAGAIGMITVGANATQAEINVLRGVRALIKPTCTAKSQHLDV